MSPRQVRGPSSADATWSTWTADGSRLQLCVVDHPDGGQLVTWGDLGRAWLVCDGRVHHGPARLSAGERAAVLAAAALHLSRRQPGGAVASSPPPARLYREASQAGETGDLFGRRKARP